MALLLGSSTAGAASVILGPVLASPPKTREGELLLGELNCLACHEASPAMRSRIPSKQSLRLGTNGMAVTPQFVRAFLLDPQSEKPGTSMPDLLHGADAATKAETVDALVHFLMSAQKPEAPSGLGADPFQMQLGRQLFHRVGCVACHAPEEPPAVTASQPGVSPAAAPNSPQAADSSLQRLARTSVPLGNLAKKTTVSQLANFLVDPLHARPSGRMPSLNLTLAEAKAIAIYLLREQAPGLDNRNPSTPLQRLKGLAYEYFEGDFSSSEPNFERLQPKGSGFFNHFSLENRRRDSDFGFRFTGFLHIDREGDYTLYSNSDDGSRVYLGTQLVVKNDGHHPMTEARGSIHLAAGDHPILVTYFNGGGEWGLKVSYEGPGLAKREIPSEVLSYLGQPMLPIGDEPFKVSAARAERGKALFGSLGCAACHEVGGVPFASAAKAKRMEQLDAHAEAGCLGQTPRLGLPKYSWSDSQRAALQATLAAPEKLAQPLAPDEQVTQFMAALNCFACHSRDGAGGPEPARSEYFTVLGEALDMGDEGRLPPRLTKVGDKLRPDWLREVLVHKGSVRPYMATRMPQFGAANVKGLLASFKKADASGQPDEPALAYSARDAKLGRKLVGRDGLMCISCHTFAQYKSLGIPAIDLTTATRRLKREWFRRYLLDPGLLRPGTRMPSFWPGGEAVNKQILDGDTEHQIRAIWTYLSKGRDADVPYGLIQARMELSPEKEPIIYRNFIEGAGSRAIAVGYPEKANLAFDANELRLALIWHGAFIDASRHRLDRGAGWEPPLGDHVIKMTPGEPFALLADSQSPWPKLVGKPAGYRMRGYELDTARRPVFRYQFQNIVVEDRFVPVPGELDPSFRRILTLRSEAPPANCWFRAAVANTVEPKSPNEFMIGAKWTLRLKFDLAKPATVRRAGGQSELLVPVSFREGQAVIEEEIIW